MLDVQAAFALAQGGDVSPIALQQGQQVVLHGFGHVGQQRLQACGQFVQFGFADLGHVQGLLASTVYHQGFFVGLKATHQGVHSWVLLAKELADLVSDAKGVRLGVGGAVVKAGAAAALMAFGEVVGDDHQGLATLVNGFVDGAHQDFAQVRPAQMENATHVAKRLDDAARCLGGNGDVDAPVHALHDHDCGGVLDVVTLACQRSL